MINTHTDASTTHVQLMTVVVTVPSLPDGECAQVFKTLVKVDKHANSGKMISHYNSHGKSLTDFTVSLTLVLQDSVLMGKYRKAMFKLRLKHPSIFTTPTIGGYY